MKETGRRIVDIEVLRGVAIIMVLAEHLSFNLYAWNTSWYGFTLHYWRGTAGVDLFFVVSGYVIASGLLPRLRASAGATERVRELARFYVRRIWRLQPLAVTWLFIPLVLCLVFNRSGAFHSFAQNIAPAAASLFSINNIWTGQIVYRGDVGIFFPYWSLSLEEQFYLLLPITALLLGRYLPFLLVVLVIHDFFIGVWPAPLFLRTGGLAIGVMLALWQHDESFAVTEPRFLARPLIAVTSLVVIVILIGALESMLVWPVKTIPWGLVPFLSAFLVYAASFDKGYVVGNSFLRSWLATIGSRSFAIYLVHVPAYAMTRELFFRLHPPPMFPGLRTDLLYLVPGLALTFLFAELSFRLIERPARRRGRRLAQGI
jgi:peptidoglycan/LPS O-acetylase OafA/YrhL